MAVVSPPTDNLYKFVSIFGLTLVISAIVLGNKAERDLSDASYAQARQIALLQARENMRVFEYDAQDSAVFAALANDTGQMGRWARRYRLISRGETISRAVALRNRAILDSIDGGIGLNTRPWWAGKRVAIVLQDSLAAEMEFLRKQEVREKSLSARLTTLFWAGIALSALGFALWYERVQKLEDRLLQARVEAADSGPKT